MRVRICVYLCVYLCVCVSKVGRSRHVTGKALKRVTVVRSSAALAWPLYIVVLRSMHWSSVCPTLVSSLTLVTLMCWSCVCVPSGHPEYDAGVLCK